MIDTRTAARLQGDQRNERSVICAIKTELQGDRRRWAAGVGSAVKSFLASDLPLIRVEWIWMWGWYKDAVDRPPHPDRVILATMTAEKEELYRHVTFLGEPILVGDPPFAFLLVDFIS